MPKANPNKGRTPADVCSLARSHTMTAIRALAGIAKDGTNEAARVHAAAVLLDRGWGKAAQQITGLDGEAIKVTIRHIVGAPEGK